MTRGEGSEDGTLARPYARGGYRRARRGHLPQGKGRKSRAGVSQLREGGGRLREPNADRPPEWRPRPPVAHCREGLAPRSAPVGWGRRVGPRPFLSETPALGEGRPPGPGPTATSAQPIPNTASNLEQTTAGKKKASFSQISASGRPRQAPGTGSGGVPGVCATLHLARALIAQ